MTFNISFSIFCFTFTIEVKLFKKYNLSTYDKYYSSVEFGMEKTHKLKVAAE